MNLKEIKEIVGLMNENDLTEVEVEREGSKIKIKRSGGEFVETIVRPSLPQYKLETHPPSQPTPSLGAEEKSGKVTKNISSPMVGTFYRSPSPEASPFVEVGQVVEIGQVVCIVEAMKLMNEIKSEIRGKVTEITVDNAEPVEFGQSMFIIEPV